MLEKYKLIGVCLSRIHEEGRFYIVDALNRHACKHGYRLMIFNACTDLYEKDNVNDIGEAAVFQLIQYHMLDAMLVLGEAVKDEDITHHIIEQCCSLQIPVFSIDHPFEKCINFSFDYSNTFEILCRHIVEEHHLTRVNMIAGMKGNRFSEERVAAFKRVLKQNRLPFREEYLGYGDFWDGPTKEVLSRWFETEAIDMPQAIICANDTMAITACKFLQDRGYRIPEDIIVTGFDGIMQSEYHMPRLTTCSQNYDEMGRKMIDVLERIRNGQPYEDSYIIDFQLKKSESCGCVPVQANNANGMMSSLVERLRLSRERQDIMCQLQIAITNMTSLAELPEIIINKFVFHTIVFAVNDDIFRAPQFGEHHRGDKAFGQNVNILYQRTFWRTEDPCIFERNQIAPTLMDMFERKVPVICCAIHFMDLILGYCVFQPDINFDEYEKIQNFMSAMDSALGIFRSQIHIKAINTQLKSVNNELEKLYIHDHMTGLYNRRGFYRQFLQQIEDGLGKDLNVVLISADLDGLKYINDTFGHLEGDNAISTVGHALMTSAIQGEVCSRFGGDEFTVAGIISDTSGYYDQFKKRFYHYLCEYNNISEKPYHVESSIGFCTMPLTDDLNLDEMIKVADDMMYQDKASRKKNRQ